jgi:endonuclease/exonuclease/phosphatase family metal-dependent hydrolase
MLLDKDYDLEGLRGLSEAEYAAMNASIYNPNKERSKIEAIAATIREGGYDFVGLCEVGGMETLVNFNKHYLNGAYDCLLHQENSRRGIFVGALVKKGRFTEVAARNVPGDFSRNLLEVRLGSAEDAITVLVVHLKSQHGHDRGIGRRIEEIRQLCGAAPRLRCVVMGDFNGILIRGQHQFEFEPFLELPFRDVLEALDVPPGARYSHFYFSGGPKFNQLDYIFCSNDIEVLGGGMLTPMVPLNYEQRRRLPSDHIFLAAELSLP